MDRECGERGDSALPDAARERPGCIGIPATGGRDEECHAHEREPESERSRLGERFEVVVLRVLDAQDAVAALEARVGVVEGAQAASQDRARGPQPQRVLPRVEPERGAAQAAHALVGFLWHEPHKDPTQHEGGHQRRHERPASAGAAQSQREQAKDAGGERHRPAPRQGRERREGHRERRHHGEDHAARARVGGPVAAAAPRAVGEAEREPGHKQHRHHAPAGEVVLADERAERSGRGHRDRPVEQRPEAGAGPDRVGAEREARDGDDPDRAHRGPRPRERRRREHAQQAEASGERQRRERRARVERDRPRRRSENSRHERVRGVPDVVRAGRQQPVHGERQRHELQQREREEASERPQRKRRELERAPGRAREQHERRSQQAEAAHHDDRLRHHAAHGPRGERRERDQGGGRERLGKTRLSRWAHRGDCTPRPISWRLWRAWGRWAAGTRRRGGRAGTPGRTRCRGRGAPVARPRARCPRR